AYVNSDGHCFTWEPQGKSGPQPAGDVGAEVNQLAFSPDGHRLACANNDFTVTVWDLTTGQRTHKLKGHLCFVSSVAFSPDGKRLASGSDDWTSRLRDLATGLTTLTLKGHQGRVLTVSFDTDGQQLLSTSEDGMARVWPAPKKEPPSKE